MGQETEAPGELRGAGAWSIGRAGALGGEGSGVGMGPSRSRGAGDSLRRRKWGDAELPKRQWVGIEAGAAGQRENKSLPRLEGEAGVRAPGVSQELNSEPWA